MSWGELLRVGLLLVDAAQEIAKAEGMDPAEFAAKRVAYERDRAELTDNAKAALHALLGAAKA